eukprot:scaffold2990_cov239-Pinguiococcus_pyrenoidosus.AAC.3
MLPFFLRFGLDEARGRLLCNDSPSSDSATGLASRRDDDVAASRSRKALGLTLPSAGMTTLDRSSLLLLRDVRCDSPRSRKTTALAGSARLAASQSWMVSAAATRRSREA